MRNYLFPLSLVFAAFSISAQTTIEYRFDALNRIKSLKLDCSILTWNYDAVNNRESLTIAGGVSFSTKLMLQGPYNSTTSLLNDNLREETLIPIKEPYASLGIQHLQGGGNEEVRGSVFSTTGNDAIVDWIFIELRNKNDNTEVLATRSALLQRDGDVVDYDGVSPVRFVNSCPDDYYVVIRHRNHLGVMTANPISLEEEPGNAIDFTNPLLPTWGTNAQREVNGVRMLWSGDTNGDGVVRYNGASNDKNAILFLVGLFTPNDVVDGYYREDVRMDGSVRYNGANNDKNAILFNVGLFTPNNIITEQLPE